MSDSPKVDCPACGKPSLRKKVSAVAFRLKGSGWYETDFKTGDKKNIAGDSQSKAPSAEKKEAAGKTDSTKAASTKADSVKSSTA